MFCTVRSKIKKIPKIAIYKVDIISIGATKPSRGARIRYLLLEGSAF